MWRATSFGLSIPGQLKVTGFDNSSLADWASHALTSIDQNISEMVRLAIDCIVDGIAGRTRIAQHVQVPGS